MGFLAGPELVGQIIPLMQMSPPPPLLSPSQACVCVSRLGGGGDWSQLLPVSAKNHTATIWMRLRLHNVAALLQPASAEPLQTGLALRAPAPAFCSSARSSVSRLPAGLFRSWTQHMSTRWCVRVCVCVHIAYATRTPWMVQF